MSADRIEVVLDLDSGQLYSKLQEATKSLRSFEKQFATASRGVTQFERANTSLLSKIRDVTIAVGGLRYAVTDLYSVFLAAPVAVAKTAGEFERLRVQLMGVSEAVDKLQEAKQLESFAINLSLNSPFDLKSISDSMVRLKTIGIDPTNGSLQALIDAIAKTGGSSENLKRATVAIQQMSGKGVISMEELRQQLGEAVPNAIGVMARSLGLTVAELTEVVSAGRLASSALTRFFTQLGLESEGAAKALADTLPGRIEALKTQFQLFQREIAGDANDPNSFISVSKVQVEELINLLKSPEAGRFARDIGEAFSAIAKFTVDGIKFIVEYRKEIMLAVGAFAAFKLSGFLARQVEELREGYARQIALVAGNEKLKLERTREALIQEELQLRKSLDARTDALANYYAASQRLAARDVELQRQINAQRRIEREALDPQSAGGRDIAVAQAARRELENLVRVKRENASAGVEVREAIVRNNKETNELISRQAQLRQAASASDAAFNALGSTVSRVTAIKQGLGSFISSFVGGLPGGLFLALQIGIGLWAAYRDRTGEVVDRMKELAAQGRLTIADLDEINNKINEIRENRAKSFFLFGDKRAEEKDLEKIYGSAQAQQIINDDAVRRGKEGVALELATADRKIAVSVDAALIATKKQYQSQIDAIAVGETKRRDAIQKEGDRTSTAIRLAGAKERLAIRENLLEKNELEVEKVAGKDTPQAAAIRARSELLRVEINNIKGQIEAAKRLGSTEGDLRPAKPVTDRLTVLLDAARGRAEAAKELFEADLDGVKTVKEEFERQYDLLAGSFSGASVVKGENVNPNDPRRKQIAQFKVDEKVRTQADQLRKELRGINLGVQQESASINFALENLFTGVSFSEFEKLEAQLQKTRLGILKEAQELAKFNQEANEILTQKAISQGNQAYIESFKQTKVLLDALPIDEKAAALNRYRTEIKAYADQLNADIDRIYRAKDGSGRRRQTEELTAQELETVGRLRSELQMGLFARQETFAKQVRTPIQTLRDEWLNTTKAMDEATAKWANSSADAIFKLVNDGKLSFGSFRNTVGTLLQEIANDILKIQLNKAIATPLTQAFEDFGSAVSRRVVGQTAAQAATEQGIADATGRVIETNSVFDQLIVSSKNLLSGFGNMVTTGVNGVLRFFGLQTEATVAEVGASKASVAAKTAELSKEVTAQATRQAAETAHLGAIANATFALELLAQSAANAALSSGASGGGGLFGAIAGIFGGSGGSSAPAVGGFDGLDSFATLSANGNIMTSMGAVKLNKYANGGIARTPQLSIFGEGKMPEAYVPLPDGRSIPVTMTADKRSAMPTMPQVSVNNAVSVNVINNSGQPVQASSAQPRFDGKKMILDVVLSAMNQPGSFRESLRSAVR